MKNQWRGAMLNDISHRTDADSLRNEGFRRGYDGPLGWGSMHHVRAWWIIASATFAPAVLLVLSPIPWVHLIMLLIATAAFVMLARAATGTLRAIAGVAAGGGGLWAISPFIPYLGPKIIAPLWPLFQIASSGHTIFLVAGLMAIVAEPIIRRRRQGERAR